jgi:hypothetical protein
MVSRRKEPSDLMRLLGELAERHHDATLQQAFIYAHQATTILDVCYLVISELAEQKAVLLKDAVSVAMLKPNPSAFVCSDCPLRAPSSRSPDKPGTPGL